MSDCCYCLGTGSESKNLKVLPCSHTYCLSCLEINYRTVGVLRCGQCLKVFTNALDSLPSKGEAEEIKMAESNCETCNPSSPAIVFCKKCKKRFCTMHKEQHDRLLTDHTDTLDMIEYRETYKKLQSRTCSQHPDRVIELGCRECHGVYCVECSNDKGGCFNADRGAKKDNQHDLRSLNLLVNSLAKAKNCVKGDASNKGHRLALLTKHTDRRVGEFDGETEKMMEELRSCRAQQNPVDSIVVHDHLLYCLVKAEASHDVYNYDIDGRLLNKWTHYDSNGSTNGMAVLSDQIVIPDRAEQKLAIYSLDGSHVRPISCPSLGNDHTSICGAGKNSVIVTSTGNNKVFKVNICTGEQEWVCGEIGEPAGVTCYTDYVLVASSNYMADVTIWVLDAYDGKLVTVLTDRTKRDRSAILNLYMDGKNLIVPRFDSHQVFFYELKF